MQRELLLTPAMHADAIAFDAWKRSLDARLIVKHDQRPLRSAASKLGHQRRKGRV